MSVLFMIGERDHVLFESPHTALTICSLKLAISSSITYATFLLETNPAAYLTHDTWIHRPPCCPLYMSSVGSIARSMY